MDDGRSMVHGPWSIVRERSEQRPPEEGHQVARIARSQLVAALPTQYNLDVLCRQLGDEILGEEPGTCRRLVHEVDKLRHDPLEIFGCRPRLVVYRANRRGHE